MSLISLFGLVLLIGACLFAWFRGGAAERSAAVAIGAAWLISLLIQAFIANAGDHREMLLLVVDGVLAAALLIIAMRWSSGWLGIAMLLQSGALACHAMEFAREIDLRTYFELLNLTGALMLAAVIGATIAYRRGLARTATRSAPRGFVPSH